MDLLDIDKASLKQKLITKDGVKLIHPPASMTKQTVDNRIRAIEIDGKVAPYLLCEVCDSIQVWYRIDAMKKQWVNMSGMKAMKNHLITCGKSVSGKSMDVKKMLQSSESLSKRRCLDAKNTTNWKNFVVDTLAENPTVSVSAHSRIVSKVANFSAAVTHSKGSLFDFSIGRTQLTDHLVKRGNESHSKLQSIFQTAKQRVDFGIAGIVDYWSARHTFLIPYGAVIICGLDAKFNWFRFPIKLENLGKAKKDACYTFEFVLNSVLGDKGSSFINPFFICSDNEAKMKAAFDGRFCDEKLNFAGRVGCVEHALSTCISDVFEKEAHADLSDFINQLSTIETFYNKRQGLASDLPIAIPEKSTTRPWRSYFNRLNALVKNYSHYQNSNDFEVFENLPPLHQCKAVFEIMTDTKYFFDKLEVSGPTAHLSFLNYLTLDMKLFKKEIGLNNALSISKKTAGHLREVMGNKLWPYSGSAFSKTAAFLTGINFRLKIRELIDSIDEDANIQNIPITQFRQGWTKEADEFESIVKAHIRFIVSNLTNLAGTPDTKSKCEAERIKDTKACDLFDTLFQSNNEPSLVVTDIDTLLEGELERFERHRQPRSDILTYWRSADFVFLRRVASIILSVPASSATIERLFSEAGIVLTKLRRRLDPEKLSALIYIKYASMCSDLYRDVLPAAIPEDNAILEFDEKMIVEIQDDDDDDDNDST